MSDVEKGYQMVPVQSQNSTNVTYPEVYNGDKRKGIVLEWSEINYSTVLPGTKEEKKILHNIQGSANPGEVLAVLGTSGAGKSTLLDILAGRLDSKLLTGSLTTNGFPVVRETFQYAAYFRVHNKSTEEKNAIADATIKSLRLESCADTIIGDENVRGLSGGEKRRVSIGVDIVNEPKVIFLDEPTSGLDSSTAYSIVDALKNIAVSQNSTVVMTIHQPSARLFSILDKVVFLAAGRVTYMGESGALLNYIGEIYRDLNLGKPPVANPPELFLELCDQLNQENRLDVVTDKYAANITKTSSAGQNLSNKSEGADEKGYQYANSLFGDIAILTGRSWTNTVRTKELFFARLGSAIFFGIQLGTLFLNTAQNDNGLAHRTSYFVFTIAFFYYTSLEALPIFLAEREIFQREYSSGAYRAGAFTISALLVTLPFMFAISMVYSCITWWLVGLPNIGSIFFFNVLTVFVVLIAGNTFSTMMSTLAPNPMLGQTAGSALFSVMFLYSGFFIKRHDIPAYWIYLHYMSLFKYAYDALLVNAFENTVTTSTANNAEILDRYSINDTNRWTGVGVLIGWIIFYRLIFYYRLVTAFNGSRK